MVLLLAFSLQDQVEKYGAYVGFAAFFGLAVLTLLYFAQARELKRLRDWAGRAPERAQELESRVLQQAEAARRVHAQPRAVPPAAPQTAAAQAAAPAPAATATAATGTPAPATAAATAAGAAGAATATEDKPAEAAE